MHTPITFVQVMVNRPLPLSRHLIILLRTIGQQRSVQDRISVAVTKGVRVTAASQLVHPEPPSPMDGATIEWQDPTDSSAHRVQLRSVERVG